MSVLDTAVNVQDQVLDAIKASQDAVLSAVTTLVEKTAPIADKLPSAPFADQLPSSVDVLDKAFGFAEKLLASQKEFATKLVEAYVPAKATSKPKVATRAA
jgi:hypothetical protein